MRYEGVYQEYNGCDCGEADCDQCTPRPTFDEAIAATVIDGQPFVLTQLPTWTKRGKVTAERQRQTKLLSGLDLDPATQELFPVDGERDD